MRIARIDLSADTTRCRDGLSGRLERLGPIVVLAGPNGGGKSRTLQRLFGKVREHIEHFHDAESGLRLAQQRLSADRERAAKLNAALQRASRKRLKAGVASRGHAFKRGTNSSLPIVNSPVEKLFEEDIAAHTETLSRFECIDVVGSGEIVHFDPKASRVPDHRLATGRQHAEARRQLGRLGVGNVDTHVSAYLAKIYERYVSTTHPARNSTEEERLATTVEWARLQQLCSELLALPLSFNDEGPTLRGVAPSDARLSEGQSVLLQLAVVLHAQGTMLNGSVLLLDEPELHLHPAASLQVLERLQKANPEGQIWIATHSLPILAWAEPTAIWYLREGQARWAGKAPETVLAGLLGGGAGRRRIEAFLSLPAQLASNRFAAECLRPPGVVETGPQDVQLQQVVAAIDGSTRILDFGAGKGRLLGALSSAHEARTPDPAPPGLECDYFAFEPDEATHQHLLDVVRGAFTDADRRVFDTEAVMLAELRNSPVEVIVMVNVLHEIHPKDWTRLFGEDGVLTKVLAPEGLLLVVEDQEIPTGEKAHSLGFLLLDQAQLKELFACGGQEAIKTASTRGGRLRAHAIAASAVKQVSAESRKHALESLRDAALQNIAALRAYPDTAEAGRLHGLWTQLFANAYVAIRELG